MARTVNLTDVIFHNGSADNSGADIYLSDEEGAQLNVGSGLVGNVYLGASSSLLSKSDSGMVVGNLALLEGATFNANIYLGGDYGNAALRYVNGKFYTASVQLIKANGEKLWFENNAAAIAAAASGDQLKLYSDGNLVLDKDLYVDINGYTVTASGSGKFYGLDSAADDYSISTGTLTASGSVTVAADATSKSGNQYLALEEDGTYTFHRIEMKITGVSIRPGSAGMYYTAKWACDKVLEAQIATYGVVASTKRMPGIDFASKEENLYTVFAADSFVNGQAKNGAVISGIMKDGHSTSNNATNGKTPVYAKAYITFENGQTLVSTDNIGYSLYDVMKNLDRLIINKPDQYRKYNQTARDFYETWKESGMGGWDLVKIPDPGEDGIIDVLMIGNSFCYYYVQELYALGQAAGIDIRVCNLYYGSCTLEKHYNWWINGESNYQYYETFHNGRKKTANVSLEWGLSQHEWDFIALQEHTPTIYSDDDHFLNTKGMWEPMASYLIEQFPNAQIMWHQTWAYQAEYGKEDQPQTPELQQINQAKVEDYVKQICDYYNLPAGETLIQRVNTGRAWQIMRTEYNYDYMCCRLGKTNHDGTANAGDGFHDGDIGGGQLLNACVWFEILTGKSVVGNSFSPEFTTSTIIDDALFNKLNLVKTDTGYALTPEFVTLIQNVAHEAVAELGLTVQ